MKVLKKTLIIVVILAAIIVCYYAYYGGFSKVEFQIVEVGGETLVYEEMKGDFSQSNAIMDSVYCTLLNDCKIETTKGFGIYYDDPTKVETAKLRSDIGCILEDQDTVRVAELSDKLLVRLNPKAKCVVTEFPFKGSASVIIALSKVYPAMNEYLKANNLENDNPIMEIYDIPNKKIYYRKAI